MLKNPPSWEVANEFLKLGMLLYMNSFGNCELMYAEPKGRAQGDWPYDLDRYWINWEE